MLITQADTKCRLCNQPRYRTATQVYPYCQEHQRERFRQQYARYRPRKDGDSVHRRKSEPGICYTEGCDKPRWQHYAHCEEHQKALNRAAYDRYKARTARNSNRVSSLVQQVIAPETCELCGFPLAEARERASRGLICVRCCPPTVTSSGSMQILHLAWRENKLMRLVVQIVNEVDMPETDRELKALLAAEQSAGAIIVEDY